MIQYQDMLRRILSEGEYHQDRTGTGTIRVFGHQLRFKDIGENFPLVTTKKIHMKSVITELLWMISGSDRIDYLHKYGCTIWDEWVRPDGSFGRIYGPQWRRWVNAHIGPNGEVSCDMTPIDQLNALLTSLRHNPESRRHIITTWNPAELEHMALPPCHIFAQFNVRDAKGAAIQMGLEEFPWTIQAKGKLDCHMYIRSWDTFLGGPFNIAQYALFTILIARHVDMIPGDLVISSGDTHIYTNHIDQVKAQLDRTPYPLPSIMIGTSNRNLFLYKPWDIGVYNYQSHPHIKGDVSK